MLAQVEVFIFYYLLKVLFDRERAQARGVAEGEGEVGLESLIWA